MAQDRVKTKYPGVFYRIRQRISENGKREPGTEQVFFVVYKKNGKTIEAKAGRQYADGMTAAKANRMRTNLIEGRELTPVQKREKERQKVWTVQALWDDYKEYKTDRSTKAWKGQVTDENRYVLHLEKSFGRKRPEDLVTLDIQRLTGRMKKAGKKPATIRNAIELLRRIVNHGIKNGYCSTDNKRLRFEMPEVDNEVTEFLTPEQLERLLESIEQDKSWKARGIMKLALFTGMRRGELFKLRWEDIDLENGFLVLRGPKGGRDQRLPVNGEAQKVLDGVPGTREGYVFPGRYGNQLQDMRKTFRRIADKAGLPKNFRPLHGLRHTYASMLASTGEVSMHVLQKLMTHKSQKMTARYAHLSDETLQNAATVAAKTFESCNGKAG
ncbi:tyrosine-type recombinase/integrase [Desulfoplanes sp.]